MYIDTTVIHQAGRFAVLAHACGVTWATAGQAVELHAVQVHGLPDRFLRAIEQRPGLWAVVDLRDLLPRSFEADVKAAPQRDDDGLALYALRGHYASAGDFKNAAWAKAQWHNTRMAA